LLFTTWRSSPRNKQTAFHIVHLGSNLLIEDEIGPQWPLDHEDDLGQKFLSAYDHGEERLGGLAERFLVSKESIPQLLNRDAVYRSPLMFSVFRIR
jgi:hypothetical protein